MSEKNIRIYLGSSLNEFDEEREEIELFIHRTSVLFEERYKIKIVPLLCETFEDAVSFSREQAYNEKLLESDLSFFIFFTRASRHAVEEFQKASEAFRLSGKPKVYVYIKEVSADETVEKSISDFLSELEDTYQHYYGRFSHLDTIKLRILLALYHSNDKFFELKVESGKCLVDGAEYLSLSGVTEFANNANLQKMRSELEQINLKYYASKAQYATGALDDQGIRDYAGLAAKRQSLLDEIEELEKQIFEMTLGMSRDMTRGEVTARQRAAYELFEKGDYEGCLHILDPVEMDDEYERQRRRKEEEIKALSSRYIREYRTRIEILEAMVDYAVDLKR